MDCYQLYQFKKGMAIGIALMGVGTLIMLLHSYYTTKKLPATGELTTDNAVGFNANEEGKIVPTEKRYKKGEAVTIIGSVYTQSSKFEPKEDDMEKYVVIKDGTFIRCSDIKLL